MAHAILRKKSCHSSWCPDCYRRGSLNKVAERLGRMDWRCIRQITLTIAPAGVTVRIAGREVNLPANPDPRQAYYDIQTQKALSQLIHNLCRTGEIKIKSWLWCLEWHRGGYAHWHLYVEQDRPGREGKIGYDLLQSYWPWGRVFEGYFRDRAHWDRIGGYHAKNGYHSAGKFHQTILPEWAKEEKRRIRRYDGNHEKKEAHTEKTEMEKIKDREKKELKKDREEKIITEAIEKGANFMEAFEILEETKEEEKKSYSAILEKCGKIAMVTIMDGLGMLVMGYSVNRRWGEISAEARRRGAKYQPGVGLVMEFSNMRDLNWMENRQLKLL